MPLSVYIDTTVGNWQYSFLKVSSGKTNFAIFSLQNELFLLRVFEQ